jgi:hypothetical protein
MENQFFVEAKSFHFAVVEGFTVLRVEERRRGFSCVMRLSKLCSIWLKSTLEELGRSSDTRDFIKSFHEGSKVSIAWRDGNSFGRYLEVVVYVVGGQRGLILILRVE